MCCSVFKNTIRGHGNVTLYYSTLDNDIKLSMDNFEVEKVKLTKFLGVIISENLSCDMNIFHSCAFKLVNILVFSDALKSKYLILCIIYLSIYILITALLFGLFHQSSVISDKLFRIRKRAIHLIATFQLEFTYSAPLFREFDVLTIH